MNSNDYSPFGVQLDGRTVTSDRYRYGFNGMEKDDKVKGKGNSYDFGARMLDPRVGRWFKMDNVTKPNLSPYEAFKLNPIIFNDPDGNDEFLTIIINNKKTGKYVEIKLENAVSTRIKKGKNNSSIHGSQYYNFRRSMTYTIEEDGSRSWNESYEVFGESQDFDIGTSWSSLYHPKFKDEKDVWFWENNREGKGEDQTGGMSLTSEDGGISSTKTKSLTEAQENDIGDWLQSLPSISGGSLGNEELDRFEELVGIFEDAKEVKEVYEKVKYVDLTIRTWDYNCCIDGKPNNPGYESVYVETKPKIPEYILKDQYPTAVLESETSNSRPKFTVHTGKDGAHDIPEQHRPKY